MATILSIIVYLLFPPLVVYLCMKFPVLNKIGIVVICYIVGITIGNIGILPENIVPIQESISEITVVIALPLLLFSMDVKKWARLAGKTILSMFLATISIIVITFIGFLVIKSKEPDSWQLAGMSIGVYTGGTPNLAAIKTALNINPTRFIIVHTYDTVISIVFIIFCITIAQRFFLLFLPAFQSNSNSIIDETQTDIEEEDIDSYRNMTKKERIIPLILSFVLSCAIVGISVLLGSLFSKEYSTSVIILSLTSAGIGASFIKKIRNIKNTFQLGMIIIYIFCFVVGSMAKFDKVIDININIMFFIAFSITGSMILHSLLCKIFKVDADTFIITSTSAICSPPFVPVVASALKNREVILSGLTTGIIGYAIGNYLGISFAYLLKNLF